MPTCNRRQFVGQAITYFMRQDYPARELLILDDGVDAIGDIVPDDPRIRYARLDERRSLGAKRNLACEMSRGELICHWDDDDWMASDRLSLQVADLLESGADVCGTRELLHYRPQAGEAWLYRYPDGERPWLAGPTLLYRRAAWEACQFADVQVGEDTHFVWKMPPDQLHAMTNHDFYVAVIHERNTAAKNLNDSRWQRQPLDAVGRLLLADRDFYAALRNGGRPTTLVQRAPTSEVTVAASFLIYDGYGSMSEYLVLGMARAGATLNVVPLALEPAGLSDELQTLLKRQRSLPHAPVLFFSWPNAAFQRFALAQDLFINTMWESNRLPADWTAKLNLARAVIVPTRFVAQVCRESGVTVPIGVVPEGVDPAVYHYQERPARAGLTTLIVGTVVERKHVREGVAAWKQAFADDPDARLLIKARFQYNNYQPDDPRISFVDVNETSRGIAHWYREADVLLALGNEGFGLPLVEGMATGLPVIALNSEGQSDVCEEAGDLLLPVSPASWQPCNDAPFGPAGVRGVPAVAEVAARLRWVAEHRDEARALGRAASEWAITHRNVWHKGPAVLATMEQHLIAPRPLRRTRTFWTPTWQLACGVAEYTRHLAEHMPNVAVTVDPPDLRAVRVLHIQHEPSLFRSVNLTRLAQQTRAQGVPVVVTEHAVTGEAQAWERDVSALVALSAHGAERLRARWPEQRVEHIPHGCPTWFPPRKTTRGRGVGAFGFLERQKGFWHLLDVVRAQPDLELVLYSYAKRPAIEAQWESHARGVPVRRTRDFLPAEEIARRLAQEADILVFWYDEATVASVSGAVRIGLASGVPVLTSPTAWFDDLRRVTYQPDDLAGGIQRLLDDTQLRDELVAGAREFCHEHCWSRIAERHQALWASL